MKVMYVVSPEYLLPFERESRDCSFYIQGYRDFLSYSDENGGVYKSAISELYKTNINDILGFIILVDSLEPYLKDINTYLQEVNKVCKGNRRRVVIGSITAKSDRYLAQLDATPNLDLFRITNINIVTDITIKRDLFGTILAGRVPYKFLDKNIKSKNYIELPTLKYNPIISKRILKVLSSVTLISEDFNKVLSYDDVYMEYLEEGDEILAYIRKIKIVNKMGKKINSNSTEYKRIYEEIEKSPIKILYKALIKECGGVL